MTDDRQAEYLKFLYQGSELLLADRIHEARDVLEKACRIDPRDAKGLSLLALVYFRLEDYDRAVDLYGHLVRRFPDEAPLRVNLGLVHMKRGEKAQAMEEMQAAVEIDPEHQRAYGYLGLLANELGMVEQAKEYFVKAGQEGMLRRLEASENEAGEEDDAIELDEGDLTIADGGGDGLAQEAERLSKEMSREIAQGAGSGGASEVPLPATAPVPGDPASPPQLAGDPGDPAADYEVPPAEHEPYEGVPADATPIFRFATDELLDLSEPPERMMALSEASVIVPVVEEGYVRATGLWAHQGNLAFARALKRSKGQTTKHPMEDGRGPFLHVTGNGVLICRADGEQLTILDLFDDFIYLRTEFLFAFESTLHFENGRVRTPSKKLDIVHVRGEGRLAMITPPDLYRLRLVPETPHYVSLDRLVGWVGRVVPQIHHQDSPHEEDGVSPMLKCDGEGVVLVTESPS